MQQEGHEFIAQRKSRINPGFFGGVYDGPFSVDVGLGSIDDTLAITISEGYLQMGSGNLLVEGNTTEVETPEVANPALPVDIWIYVKVSPKLLFGGWTVSYIFAVDTVRPKPVQEDVDGFMRWAYPIVCARGTLLNGVVTNIIQLQYGDAQCAGVLS